MSHSTESGHKQIEPEMPSNPTVQQMKDWDKDELIQWIRQALAILGHEVKEGGEFIPWT